MTRLTSLSLLLAGAFLGVLPGTLLASSPDDPFYGWDLEWYRIVRTPDQPSGGILPIPAPPEPPRAPIVRAAGWSIDGLRTDREIVVGEGDGLRLREGGSTRLYLDGLLPFPLGLGVGLAGRAALGEVEPKGAKWLERNLSWRSRRVEILAGITRASWGDGEGGSLLLGRTAPPFDMARVRTIRPLVVPGTRSIARFHGSIFLGYLNDRNRTVPFPLLQGTRLEWEPSRHLRLSGTRTILLGGAGRTEKLNLSDVWKIWWGRGENAKGPRDYRDTDQKVSFGLELRLPPSDRLPYWFDGARAFYEYAGEDSFDGLLPTAVAHLWGGTLGFSGWLAMVEFAETVDDANWWYTNHTTYGPESYFYRGFVMGHPAGSNAKSGRLRIWTPAVRSARAQVWLRAVGRYDHRTRRTEEWEQSAGLRICTKLTRFKVFETGLEATRTVLSHGGDSGIPVQVRATMALRMGGGLRQGALTAPAPGW